MKHNLPLCHTLTLIHVTMLTVGCSHQSTERAEGPDANHLVDQSDRHARPAKDRDAVMPAVFYSVSHYDENQDPSSDLSETIQRASAEEKRILLQVGGEWCSWCHRISNYMETNAKVHEAIDKNFVVMKVTYPGKHAKSFLASYPTIPGYPHFFVLEQDGTLLHSQGTAELEKEESYDQEVFCQFLATWSRQGATTTKHQ